MNNREIMETIKMIKEQHLDVRTITMGISLLDCMDTDINRSCEKVYNKIYNYAKDFVNCYDEKIVNEVIEKIKYKKSTISFLNNILDYFNVENNLNKRLSSLSKYNHIDMEEIYELAQMQERF